MVILDSAERPKEKIILNNDSRRIPVGARLYPFRKAWQGATHEGTVRLGLSWNWQYQPPKLKRLRQRHSKALDRILRELKRKRVIEKARQLRWQSRLFTVPKRDSQEDRLILDLSQLNLYIACPSFKMLTIKEIKYLLPRGYWTISIDFLDGYWHVPVAPSKRPYLGFTYRNQDYQFRAMPFGLNVAPRTFTKVMSHLVKVLASAGIWCLPYLDDLLLIAATREECIRIGQIALTIIKDMGLLINEKKSRLTPAQDFEWLGIRWNLLSFTAQVVEKKFSCLQEDLASIITSKHCTKRTVMKIQGLCNWIGQSDHNIRLLMTTTRIILKFHSRAHPDSLIQIPRNLKIRLCAWVNAKAFPQQLGSPTPDLTIQTDASLHGWGFIINQIPFNGRFTHSMKYSINIKELIVIWLALLKISERNITIQVLCDNSSAIQVLQRGGSMSYHLYSLAELIWKRVTRFNWTLKVSHIKGTFNVIADQLSRNNQISTEWSLSDKDFQKVLEMNPLLEVDLFATKLNKKLPIYVSPCPDPEATALNSLTIPWDKWNHLYLYPPTPLISKVLCLLSQFSYMSAVLITPDTPTRPWFMALQLQKVPSTVLEVKLQQIVVNKLMIQPHTTKLRAWKLSGQHIEQNLIATSKRKVSWPHRFVSHH